MSRIVRPDARISMYTIWKIQCWLYNEWLKMTWEREYKRLNKIFIKRMRSFSCARERRECRDIAEMEIDERYCVHMRRKA